MELNSTCMRILFVESFLVPFHVGSILAVVFHHVRLRKFHWHTSFQAVSHSSSSLTRVDVSLCVFTPTRGDANAFLLMHVVLAQKRHSASIWNYLTVAMWPSFLFFARFFFVSHSSPLTGESRRLSYTILCYQLCLTHSFFCLFYCFFPASLPASLTPLFHSLHLYLSNTVICWQSMRQGWVQDGASQVSGGDYHWEHQRAWRSGMHTIIQLVSNWVYVSAYTKGGVSIIIE